jgi:hypothetical protein
MICFGFRERTRKEEQKIRPAKRAIEAFSRAKNQKSTSPIAKMRCGDLEDTIEKLFEDLLRARPAIRGVN